MKMEKSIQVSEEQTKELTGQARGLEGVVYGINIYDATTCSRGESLLKDCMGLEKKIKGFFGPAKKAATDLHKQIVTMEKDQLQPVSDMKKYLKESMSEFIRKEDEYNDGLHNFNRAMALANSIEPEIPEWYDRGCFDDLLAMVAENMEKQRSDVETAEFKQLSNEVYDGIDSVRQDLIFTNQEHLQEPEVSKPKTNLRKLSTRHEISVNSIKQLVNAVAFGDVPADWISVNESAIRRDAKAFETQKAFHEKYPGSGVTLKINKGLR